MSFQRQPLHSSDPRAKRALGKIQSEVERVQADEAVRASRVFHTFNRSELTTSSTTFEEMISLRATGVRKGDVLAIDGSVFSRNDTANAEQFIHLAIDGAAVAGGSLDIVRTTFNYAWTVTWAHTVTKAGSVLLQLMWKVDSGVATIDPASESPFSRHASLRAIRIPG